MAEKIKEEFVEVKGIIIRSQFDGIRKTKKGEDLFVLTLLREGDKSQGIANEYYTLTFYGVECEKAKIIDERFLQSQVVVYGKMETKQTERGNIRKSFFNPSVKFLTMGRAGIELPDGESHFNLSQSDESLSLGEPVSYKPSQPAKNPTQDNETKEDDDLPMKSFPF